MWTGVLPLKSRNGMPWRFVLTCCYGCMLSTSCVSKQLQVSDALLSLLLADEREALKITSTGLKLFERQEMKGKQTSKCNYRIAQVGPA